MNQQLFQNMGVTLPEQVDYSLKVLRAYEPREEPYFGCFSGGKDSCVIKHLASLAGLRNPVDWTYSVTTIDPPELVYFIRKGHPDVVWRRPKQSLWTMVAKRGLPTRRLRWCCAEYKETGGAGRTKITGIRAGESPRRARQWKICTNHNKAGWVINPILHWTDDDVWEYIRQENIPYCSLYDSGFKRLGCVGCPMSHRRADELKRWPLFERNWRRAARRRWDVMLANGSTNRALRTFADADEWFDWWVSNLPMPTEDDCQMGMF